MEWDEAVASGSKEYMKRTVCVTKRGMAFSAAQSPKLLTLHRLLQPHFRQHNLFCDNCHSHVALCLRKMQYGRSTHWGMFRVGAYVALFGHYVR